MKFVLIFVFSLLLTSLAFSQATTFQISHYYMSGWTGAGGFYVNNQQNPRLQMTRGTKYTFVYPNFNQANASPYPHIFTIIDPSNGTVYYTSPNLAGVWATVIDTFTVPTSAPDLLKYLCPLTCNHPIDQNHDSWRCGDIWFGNNFIDIAPYVPPPGVPVLHSPVSNSVNIPVTATLIWHRAAAAASYRLQVATDSLFSSVIFDNSGITDSTKILTGLLNKTKYFWRVNATNAVATGSFSEIWKFTTIIGNAAVPVLVSPPNNALYQPLELILKWNHSVNAAKYRVQVSTDAQFGTLIFEDSTLVDTSCILTNLSYTTQYFWRVSAKNAAGTTAFSSLWNFTTAGLYALSGSVYYYNIDGAPLDSTLVSLMQNSSAADSIPTSADGSFLFPEVMSGTYTLEAERNTPWGGANSTDALIIRRYVASLRQFDSLQIKAADVNRSSTITSTDALLLRRRFVGLDTAFAAGDWVFEFPIVAITNSAVTQNMFGLCTGDVNASFMPGILKTNQTVDLLVESSVIFEEEKDFMIPVFISAHEVLGAVSLRFEYPEESIDIKSISGKMAGMLFNAKDGILSIAWDGIDGISFTENEPMFTIAASVKNGKGSDIHLKLLPEFSEFADTDANILQSVTLVMPEINLSLPKDFSLSQNFPNPFNPTTTIQYDIPTNAHVRVEIFNTLGEVVEVLADAVQAPGRYSVEWNAKNFTTGVYFYRITAESGTKNFMQVKKLMLIK